MIQSGYNAKLCFLKARDDTMGNTYYDIEDILLGWPSQIWT